MHTHTHVFIDGAKTSKRFDTLASRQIASLVRESYRKQQDVLRNYPLHLRKTIVPIDNKSELYTVYTLAPTRFLFFR
jgi:hypothetical protein